MGRYYRRDLYGEDDFDTLPPLPRPGGPDLRGLTKRHWGLLALLAEHGVLDTSQATTLMFGSRPAASRHLNALANSGLALRFVFAEDRTHAAYYELSADDAKAVTDRFTAAGLIAPPKPGEQRRDQTIINDVCAGLVQAGRDSNGTAWLFRWRRSVDTLARLRTFGVTGVDPGASGVWIEDGRAVQFLLHIDDRCVARLHTEPLSQQLHGYRDARNGIPATVILVFADNADREHDLHRDLTDNPLGVHVAVTTTERLSYPCVPAEAIWTRVHDRDRSLVRLIDAAR